MHLTYKSHIDVETIEEHFREDSDNGFFYRTKMYSIVHELGDKDEDNAVKDHDYDKGGYAHTHVFWWWKEPKDTTNPRYFDIDGIHPHIQGNKGLRWAKGIVMEYHKGRKTKASGKKYFIEPVLLKQYGVEEWHFEADMFATIRAAPDLEAACMAVDVTPKSIGDVKTLRTDSKKRSFTEMEDGVSPDNCKEVDWDRSKALVLKGSAGSGKTNWALAQFKNPCMIEDIDELKGVPADCDGLVFDEMLFDLCPKKTQVYLTDLAFTRTIRCRNSNGKIRRGMARIFTCNEHEFVFGADPHASVRRRYNTIDVDKDFDSKMFI